MVRRACVLLMLLVWLSPCIAAAQGQPAGNVDEGKRQWGTAPRCQNCHGPEAKGAFGPDLAGRGLSLEQFRKAVREPWGVMPAWGSKQLTDQAIADMWAYTSSLPKATQIGRAKFVAPASAPLAQAYIVDTLGCAQCHGPELRQPRKVLGGEASEVTFEFFADLVYNHEAHFPAGRMGSYSRRRAPESVLREVFTFVSKDLGLLEIGRAHV